MSWQVEAEELHAEQIYDLQIEIAELKAALAVAEEALTKAENAGGYNCAGFCCPWCQAETRWRGASGFWLIVHNEGCEYEASLATIRQARGP